MFWLRNKKINILVYTFDKALLSISLTGHGQFVKMLNS